MFSSGKARTPRPAAFFVGLREEDDVAIERHLQAMQQQEDFEAR
jgi:hypothetical protein